MELYVKFKSSQIIDARGMFSRAWHIEEIAHQLGRTLGAVQYAVCGPGKFVNRGIVEPVGHNPGPDGRRDRIEAPGEQQRENLGSGSPKTPRSVVVIVLDPA